MAESKVVSIRIPQELLDAIDRLAAVRYPSRRGGEANRSQLILDFIEQGIQTASDDTVDNRIIVSSEAIETQLDALVDEKLSPIQEKLAALESELEKVKRLRDEAQSLRQERTELQEQVKQLQTELDQRKAEEPRSADLPDLEAMRDRILSGLKLGKQAPQYKAAAKALDRLIALVRSP